MDFVQLAKLAQRMPRKKNLVIFVGRSGGHFIDNAKYAFLHCVNNMPELSCYFFTMNPKLALDLRRNGLPAIGYGDEGAIELLLRAGIVVADDFEWRVTPELYSVLHPAVSIQLWHGIPLKAIGFPEIESSINMTPEKAERLQRGYSDYDALLSTSPYYTEHAFSKAFKAEDFPELGYPRNDVMLRRPTKQDMINADLELYAEIMKRRKQGWKTVFYMPTFRDLGGDPFTDQAISLPRLNEFGNKHKVLFVLKLHPYVHIKIGGSFDNIKQAEARSDIYPLLGACDILLTDYSSIYFDFLLADKPIVFYPYDYTHYVTANRALLFDYDATTPGPRANTQNELYDVLQATLEGQDTGKEQRAALRVQAFTHADGNAAQRLGQYITERFVTRGD
ncbi:CDP-glycerol glycerophosphotransferase family protein [Oleidesulfovibrio sp.]|uniref:CDP-glycerol glycerophosphotransferase family protein n=1 Tax=Oleidesulfovibrio sp. TaxID=2909707 RepID=UPI003A8909C1